MKRIFTDLLLIKFIKFGIHSIKDGTVIASGANQSHNYLQIRRLLRQKTPRNDMLSLIIEWIQNSRN